jgi:hypothetical protein
LAVGRKKDQAKLVIVGFDRSGQSCSPHRNQLFCVCGFLSDCVSPPSISPVGVDRIDPLLSCLRLYLGSFVVAFNFEDEVRRRLGLESDDKVGT